MTPCQVDSEWPVGGGEFIEGSSRPLLANQRASCLICTRLACPPPAQSFGPAGSRCFPATFPGLPLGRERRQNPQTRMPAPRRQTGALISVPERRVDPNCPGLA